MAHTEHYGYTRWGELWDTIKISGDTDVECDRKAREWAQRLDNEYRDNERDDPNRPDGRLFAFRDVEYFQPPQPLGQ